MDFIRKIKELLSSPPPKTERAIYLDVKCARCGEKLRARVDIWNELTPEFDEEAEAATSYHCRKVLIGENKCYQPIELRLKFDKNHKLVEKTIQGGMFIDVVE